MYKMLSGKRRLQVEYVTKGGKNKRITKAPPSEEMVDVLSTSEWLLKQVPDDATQANARQPVTVGAENGEHDDGEYAHDSDANEGGDSGEHQKE